MGKSGCEPPRRVVRLRDGLTLDETLIERIKRQIRAPAPCPDQGRPGRRHPAHQVRQVVELAVRDVVHGRPVKNREALELLRDLPEPGR